MLPFELNSHQRKFLCGCMEVVRTEDPWLSYRNRQIFICQILPLWNIDNNPLNQWRMLRGGRLIIMSGTEQMEWQQTQGNHVFNVVDTVPPILLQPLPRAHPPQLRCHQSPVLWSCVYVWIPGCWSSQQASYLRATRYFIPSFSISAITQSVMHGIPWW